MSLEGKTLFITGASRGIGLAIALKAAKDGANINLRNIEKPNYDFDREGWLRRLAMSHWRLDEIRSGECWMHMKQWVKR